MKKGCGDNGQEERIYHERDEEKGIGNERERILFCSPFSERMEIRGRGGGVDIPVGKEKFARKGQQGGKAN